MSVLFILYFFLFLYFIASFCMIFVKKSLFKKLNGKFSPFLFHLFYQTIKKLVSFRV